MREIKDSGEKWIGSIPVNWKIEKISSKYSIRNTKVSDRDYEPLSVTMQGVVPQLETAAKTDAHDDRKLVKKGDFAINSRSDRRGSCGIADRDGSISLINIVLKPRGLMHPGYYNWLFHTPQFSSEFYRWGHGIVDDLWTTGWQDMKKINIPVPSFVEQTNISNFLDKKCAEIDSLTDDIQKQIEILEQYKKSVITDAVTKGLNSNIEMKDSGCKYIGTIPKHWGIKRLRYIAQALYKGTGITKEQVFEDGDSPCVRYGEIYSVYNNTFSECASKTINDNLLIKQYFSKGDILFAGTGELVEEIGKNILYTGDERCLAGGDIIVLKHNQNAAFLNYALGSEYSQQQKSSGKSKLKVVHISATDISNIYVALPPIEEQKQISDFLNKKYSEITEIIESKNQQIATLESYKKSLIYEYVTGKKEVF